MELGKEVQITGHWGEKITAYEAGSKPLFRIFY